MSPESCGVWLGDPGPDGDVVVSVRVRLARNLSGFPFVRRATETQKSEVVRAVTQGAAHTRPDLQWHLLGQSDPAQVGVMVERHLISKQFAVSTGPRSVGISPDDSCSVMINEEDHLRIQALRSGNRLDETFAAAMELESALGGELDYAYHERWGFLTACPTNVGCGIRISAMMHLPALRMYKELDRVRRAAKDLHLAIRGFFGEGSETVADFYQVSNQVTLGISETDLLANFREVIVPRMVEYERETKGALLQKQRLEVEDRVLRSLAILRVARLLSADRAMKYLGDVRFGVSAGLVQNVTYAQLNRLMLSVQPAHMAAASNKLSPRRELGLDSAREEAAQRASLLRQSLAGVTTD